MTDTPTPEADAPPAAGGRTFPGGRRGLTLALVALAVVVAVIVGIVVATGDDSSSEGTTGPAGQAIEPVVLTAAALRTIGGTVGEPLYWAGPMKGFKYELRRTTNRSLYVRYLPEGTKAGAPGGDYLTVATYPYTDALGALKKVSGGREIDLPGGGIAVVDSKYPKSVHLAFPKVDYQVEVYDPSPERAREVASSGNVRPAGRD